MDFRERNIVVLVRSKPFGKIVSFEGWRAAVGMFGMDHKSTLLFMGEGVYSLLKTIDETPIRMFKSTYEGFDGKICVSRRSLAEHGITPAELFDGVQVLDEAALSALLGESDVVITF